MALGPWRSAGAGLTLLILFAFIWHATTGVSLLPNWMIDELWTAGLVLGIVVAIAATLYGDVSGHARAVRAGTVAWIFLASRLASGLPIDERYAPVLSLAAAAWFLAGLLGPDVDTRRRLGRDFVLVGLVTAPSTLFAVLLLALLEVPAAAVLVAAAVMWAVDAAVCARQRLRSGLVGWMTWVCVGFAFSAAAAALASAAGSEWLAASELVRSTALFVASTGAVVSLSHAASERRRRLHDVELSRRAERESVADQVREQTHELRNALLAVEGASLTLQRLRDSLTPELEAELSQAMESGFERLRALVVSGKKDEDEVQPSFELGDLFEVERVLARELGVRLEVAGGPSVEVDGRGERVAQIVENIVINAQRHAGADLERGVRVAWEVTSQHVLVTFADEGPGIPRHRRHTVFDAGRSWGTEGEGSGLGLFVSRKIALELGGDLLLAPSSVGARFLLVLPIVGAGLSVADEGLLDWVVLDRDQLVSYS